MEHVLPHNSIVVARERRNGVPKAIPGVHVSQKNHMTHPIDSHRQPGLRWVGAMRAYPGDAGDAAGIDLVVEDNRTGWSIPDGVC
ncbi:hypothetical protein ES703_102739 [subsurface metagenome]